MPLVQEGQDRMTDCECTDVPDGHHASWCPVHEEQDAYEYTRPLVGPTQADRNALGKAQCLAELDTAPGPCSDAHNEDEPPKSSRHARWADHIKDNLRYGPMELDLTPHEDDRPPTTWEPAHDR